MADPVLALLDAWRRASNDGGHSRTQRARANLHGLFKEVADREGAARNCSHAAGREAVATAVADAVGGVPAICLVNHDPKQDLASALIAASEAPLLAACVVVIIDRTDDAQGAFVPDCRIGSRTAALPVMEFAEPGEFLQAWHAARELSEEFVCPVVLRFVSARTLDWEIAPPAPLPGGRAPSASPYCVAEQMPQLAASNAMAPTRAAARTRELCNFADSSAMNFLERRPDRRIGYIVSDYAYPAVRARHPEATILRLGLSFPFPLKLIRGIVEMCETVVVVEGGHPLMAEELAAEGLTVLSALLAFGGSEGNSVTGHSGPPAAPANESPCRRNNAYAKGAQ